MCVLMFLRPSIIGRERTTNSPSSVDLVADAFAGNFISYMCLAKARTPLTGGKEGAPDAKFGAPLANTASASGLTTRRQKKSDLMKIQQKIMNGEDS